MQNATARVSSTKVGFIPLNSILVLLLSLGGFGQAQAPATASAAKAPGFYDPLPQDTGEAGLKQELRKLQTTGRLMMVVAHPDDEDGGLLTLEARGKGVQTLLMTLTRGEGGQNKTGDTFSDELGVLRTLELLAADRYYGVEQRFSRVADFGYSKTPEETFQKWGGHDVPLADIVRVIREFRPDILVARFSGTDRDGHGHHQASAILTKEAFRAAADPNRFPEQIKEGLQPWQAKKLYIGNVCGFGASTCADENYTVKINTGELDPVLGMSYAQFAIEGLKHQQSQGLADISIPSGPRYAFYKLEDSVLPKTTDEKGHERDLFEGIDTSLSGIAATARDRQAAENTNKAEAAITSATHSGNKDAASVVRPLLAALQFLDAESVIQDDSPYDEITRLKLIDKEIQLRSAIDLALNVNLDASLASLSSSLKNQAIPAISPDQKFSIKVAFHNGSPYPIRLDSIGLDMERFYIGGFEYTNAPTISPGQNYEHTFDLVLSQAGYTKPGMHRNHPGRDSFFAEYTKPGMHRNDPQRDSVFVADQPGVTTLPFAAGTPPTARASYEVLIPKDHTQRASETNLPEAESLVTASVSDTQGQKREQLAIVPVFSVSVEPGNQVVPVSTHSPTTVRVRVSSNVDGAPAGTLRLETPSGWTASPLVQNIPALNRSQEQTFKFEVSTPHLQQGDVKLSAVLDAGGKKYSEGYTLVTREDLGAFYYFEPAVQHVSIVDVKVPKDLKVGYIMGAGDDIPNVLQQIGMHVTIIPAEKIASEDLAQYGTIVLGVRAYDTDKDLVANNKKLLDFVSGGGTLIVQNNNSVGDFNSGHFTPFPAELSRARVSVEEAPVQILDPGNSVFHYPNEISKKDFDGWVQERGLYFMDSWDDHFKPLLSCHDPGESDQKGGMLEAQYGKGTYIYTGYAFFRQLPAGVPGAIRLFVNLVSSGHEASVSK
ncbi:MAG TPA: PIG-L family deacetylase [Terriglobales bacterium]